MMSSFGVTFEMGFCPSSGQKNSVMMSSFGVTFKMGFCPSSGQKQGWQSSVCNSTDGRTDGRNFRPRLVSSHDFWDERYFVRLFGRLQVELKYDRCSL